MIETYLDRFVVGVLSYGLFKRTLNLRGFENLLFEWILEENFYDESVEKMVVEAFLDSKIDK